LADVLLDLKRSTQILYPKDMGYILIHLGIGPGQRVIEAGTGSGAMTTALAYSVGNEGKIISYDQNADFQKLARKNLRKLGLEDRVEFKLRDIAEGLDETDADAFFLDVAAPHDYITQVKQAVKPGGFFGCLVPTTNQVSLLITALRQNQFAFIEVVEVLLRYYKPEPQRLRPADRMVAHTGFLVFARPMIEESFLDTDRPREDKNTE
jgi:tRNA (adenine57-N1/adenine58-N1)-methyltransferase